MAKWLWPCPVYTRISSGVGPRWGSTHKGIDIASPEGSPILASRDGVVKRSAYSKSYGNVVYLTHSDGTESRYAHMVEFPMVIEGDRVSQGQQIGKVGSTGYSTGNHLHFEVRSKDGNIIDPETLVDPSNSLPDTGYTYIPDIANQYSNPISTDYIDGIVPVMTSDFINGQPFHAYLIIKVGDMELIYEDGKPNIIQSFEINRLEDAGCTAQFVLFDDNWNDLEPYLASNHQDIRIQYGYVEGPMSPEYKMVLLQYSISFTNTGTILSIQAVSEAIYENLETIDFDTGTNNPSEALRKICDHIGLTIDEEDFIETEPVEGRETYYVSNVNPIQYINEVILPEIKAQGDIDDTVVFYIDAIEGKVAHLKSKTYGVNSITDESLVPTYVYMKGYDSVIESLTINTKGVFGGTTQFHTVTGLEANIIQDDKTEKTVSVDLDSAASTSSGVGDYSSTKANQSKMVYHSAGESLSQIGAKLNYYIKNGASQAYEATMVILGDPSIQILQDVRLLILTDRDSELHHTSGIYIVTGISDTIENGTFRTTLILRRNGDTQGVVLRSHKYKRV